MEFYIVLAVFGAIMGILFFLLALSKDLPAICDYGNCSAGGMRIPGGSDGLLGMGFSIYGVR